MKKIFSSLAICVALIFVFGFLMDSRLNNFFSSQVATVLGIHTNIESCPNGANSIFTDEILVHVNKDASLAANYIPNDLVNISSKVKTIGVICLKEEVATFLKKMFSDASKEKIKLAVTSGFRPAEVQSVLYEALIQKKGEKAKDRIAKPMHSEHQLGTAVDLSGKSIDYLSADDSFKGTAEEMWLEQNAYKYGFVLSYPKDKTLITGYDYEPWHYRFIGISLAKKIFEKNMSVEEYFGSIDG